jgi:hypothetical protein
VARSGLRFSDVLGYRHGAEVGVEQVGAAGTVVPHGGMLAALDARDVSASASAVRLGGVGLERSREWRGERWRRVDGRRSGGGSVRRRAMARQKWRAQAVAAAVWEEEEEAAAVQLL